MWCTEVNQLYVDSSLVSDYRILLQSRGKRFQSNGFLFTDERRPFLFPFIFFGQTQTLTPQTTDLETKDLPPLSSAGKEMDAAGTETDKPQIQRKDVSSAEAVLLGALASGVNGQTWAALQITFLTLGVCLAAMLGLAFSSSDSTMIIHVFLLVIIAGVLFFLLSGFLAETGLVTIEQQIQEIGVVPKDQNEQNKKRS